MPDKDVIKHHGVKGMKWGKRKSSGSTSTPSDDHLAKLALKGKKVSELSNADLKKLNERRQLEQRYKDLNPDPIKKGHNAVKTVIALAGTAAAVTALAKSPAAQKGAAAIAKIMAEEGGRHAVGYVAKAAPYVPRHLA